MSKLKPFNTYPHRLLTTKERFFRVVIKGPSNCWVWCGNLTKEGYARFSVSHSKTTMAHRWYYENFVKPVPKGFQLDHLCRVRNCVNPDHLEIVTPRENSLRGHTLAAENAAKTHCPQGHQYSEENTGHSKGRRRYCRLCKKLKTRIRRAK